MLVVYGVPGSPGASTTAIHVAAHWASSGREVLLIEADSAGGSMSRNMGIQFTPGAASFVASGSPVRKGDLIDHSQDVLFTNLHVMPCPSNPSSTREIIESFAERAEELRDVSENDMAVVIDAGRIEPGPFTELWTASAAGVAVVARGDSGSSMSSLEGVAGVLAAGSGNGSANGCVVTIGKPLWSPDDFPQKCGMGLYGTIEDSPETAVDMSVFLDKAKRKDKKWRSSLKTVAEQLLPLAAPEPSVRPRPSPAAAPAAPVLQAVPQTPAPQPEVPAAYQTPPAAQPEAPAYQAQPVSQPEVPAAYQTLPASQPEVPAAYQSQVSQPGTPEYQTPPASQLEALGYQTPPSPQPQPSAAPPVPVPQPEVPAAYQTPQAPPSTQPAVPTAYQTPLAPQPQPEAVQPYQPPASPPPQPHQAPTPQSEAPAYQHPSPPEAPATYPAPPSAYPPAAPTPPYQAPAPQPGAPPYQAPAGPGRPPSPPQAAAPPVHPLPIPAEPTPEPPDIPPSGSFRDLAARLHSPTASAKKAPSAGGISS